MEKFLTGFCFFVIYSFIGWICETAFCSIPAKKFINRGFLNGPFCPIYGTGAVLVLWLFSRYQDDIAVLFVMSTVVTSIIEYITSYLLEKIFHLSLWDYSKRWANLNGRICLRNSLLFGVMSVLMVKVIHPYIKHFLSLWPSWLVLSFTCFLAAYFIADLAVTCHALLLIKNEARNRKMKLEELASLRDEAIERMHEERKEKKERKRRSVRERLLRAFPHMESKQYPEALAAMRKELHEELQRRKGIRKMKKRKP